jgi:hypothetical protein
MTKISYYIFPSLRKSPNFQSDPMHIDRPETCYNEKQLAMETKGNHVSVTASFLGFLYSLLSCLVSVFVLDPNMKT